MNIIPAIDLINGQCVRLKKGDFNAVTKYTQRPDKVAKTYEKSGAKYLHVVDLNGAKTGSLCQLDLIRKIRQSCKLIMQAGGGVKNQQTIKNILDSGIDRVVLGSISVSDFNKTKDFIRHFGVDKIVLALDVNTKDGEAMVATHGWLNMSDKRLDDLLDQYTEYGLKHVLCTDISKDGMLQGTNNTLYKLMVAKYPNISFQASGGVGSITDLMELKKTGVQNVIVGRALYENKFSLSEVLRC